MRMNFAVRSVYHKPFKFICFKADYDVEEFFPEPRVAPTPKSLVNSSPFAIIGRQIPPWCAGSQYPKHSVDKSAVVLGYATPLASLPGQIWFQFNPYCVGDIMAMIVCIHRENLFAFSLV
jgi:hypothetical protein